MAGCVGEQLGGAQVVGVVVEDGPGRLGRGRWRAQGVGFWVVGDVGAPGGNAQAFDRRGVHLGQGREAGGFEEVMDGARAAGFKSQGVAVPAIEHYALGPHLGQTPA